ncbi:MAG: hypothetical protein U5K69_02270 [Balneolaceae bacterium]|nr:hypothetical protein [Balneolaceae bacterium]
MIWGLLELYEATFNTDYLRRARRLNDIFLDRFWDDENGAFYFTSHESKQLIGRKKEAYDGAIPSGNSVAMMNLLRLGRITGQPELEEKANNTGRLYTEQLEQAPSGFGQMLQGILFELGTTYEIVIAGKKESADTKKLLKELHSHLYSPQGCSAERS